MSTVESSPKHQIKSDGRSGIGAASLLEKHKISTIVDLPGVGENYMSERPFDSISRYKCHEQTTMLFSRHTLQAKMQIRSTPFSEGRKLNLNVSRFTVDLLRSAKAFLAFNLQWLQNGKGLLSHKLRSPFTMRSIIHLTWERQVQSMQASEYDQMQRTSRQCPSLRRDGRPTSPIRQTNLSWSLPLRHRRFSSLDNPTADSYPHGPH